MARPRTQLGTHGKITLTGHVTAANGRRVVAPKGVKPTSWRARTKVRDRDGKVRDVESWGLTKPKADAALRLRLSERITPTGTRHGWHRDMSMGDAAAKWLAEAERAGELSPNTLAQYRDAVRRYLTDSSLANLSLSEGNRVAVLQDFLQGVADAHGLGSAKTARTVLRGILSRAVVNEAADWNRVRDTRPAKRGKARPTERDTERAFTRAELADVLAKVTDSPTAEDSDLVDFVHVLAGTGARISEALALRWDDVDLDSSEVSINGTKTRGSRRIVTVPDWLTERLRSRRLNKGAWGLVFATPGRWGETTAGRDAERPRDRRNVTRDLRKILDAAGYPWATAHTFRTTVADLVAEAAGPTEAANMLGHARPSMTLDRYTDRRQRTTAGASALTGLGG